MADGILFDKACRGYDREQVNAFILKLNTSYQEQLSEQEERFEAQNEELLAERMISDGLREEKESLLKEIADLRESEELIKMQADELAASLRELHTNYTALKQSYDELKKAFDQKESAVEVCVLEKDGKLSEKAQERFALVCAAKDKILSKLTSDRIVISKEELTKLVDRLSADAADFYRTFTEGNL